MRSPVVVHRCSYTSCVTLAYGPVGAPSNYPLSPNCETRTETTGRSTHNWTDFAGSEFGITNLTLWGLVDQQHQLHAYIGVGPFGLSGPLARTISKRLVEMAASKRSRLAIEDFNEAR